MHSIQLKGSAFPAAATTSNRPAISNSPWREKLDASHADALAKLLQKSGLITKEQYCDAAEIAESISKSIDHVLFTSFLTNKQAELCASALSYIERGIVTEELAGSGLSVAAYRNVSFEEGLKYFGFGW